RYLFAVMLKDPLPRDEVTKEGDWTIDNSNAWVDDEGRYAAPGNQGLRTGFWAVVQFKNEPAVVNIGYKGAILRNLPLTVTPWKVYDVQVNVSTPAEAQKIGAWQFGKNVAFLPGKNFVRKQYVSTYKVQDGKNVILKKAQRMLRLMLTDPATLVWRAG